MARGNVHALEGDWDPIAVTILRFDTKEALMAWYDSPEYAPLKQMRLESNTGDIIVVDGEHEAASAARAAALGQPGAKRFRRVRRRRAVRQQLDYQQVVADAQHARDGHRGGGGEPPQPVRLRGERSGRGVVCVGGASRTRAARQQAAPSGACTRAAPPRRARR